MLWAGISKDIGTEAARNFVLMVESMDDMSASAFLVGFEHYFSLKFRWDDRKQSGADGVTVSGYEDAMFREAEVCVMNVLANRNKNAETNDWVSRSIKMPFLAQHSANRTKLENYEFSAYGRAYPLWSDNGDGESKFKTDYHAW